MSDLRQKEYLVESFLSMIGAFSVAEQQSIVDELNRRFLDKVLSPTKLFLPTYIFVKELGALESICKYLRDEVRLSSPLISELVQRSVSTIEISYGRASKKFPGNFVFEESVYTIPLSIFSFSFGVQESIVAYLKDHYGLQYNQIATILNRNYQTVRTAYLKYREKNEKKK
ncbi:MAG: hypothetical protein ACOC32_00660 [Nanoarchaeota archaeon]